MTTETFIARQPILDRRREVQAYELLHRSGWTNSFAHEDPDRATIEVLNTSMLVNRLTDLTDGRPAFINVTRQLLVEDFIRVLPPESTVIEILEDVEPDDEVLAAVRELKAAGHRIALDDFVDGPEYDELVELADYIKVDFLATTPERRREVLERRRRPGLEFLAEKVETLEEFEEARDLGYSLFQGYFFCKPEVSSRREPPKNAATYLQFLQEMGREDLDIDAIEELIRREISLSTKLLRYLNSAHFGVRERMTSIRQALIHLGQRPLKRWGTLIALSGIGGEKPTELIRVSLVRARFCELLGAETGPADDTLDHFLTGLFSALDALTDQPMEAALSDLGLNPEIERVLTHDPAQVDLPLARSFCLARACEAGDVLAYQAIARRVELPETRVAQLYAEALFWADQVLRPELLVAKAS